MNINTFRIIYHGAVMNDDGTLHWDHFADALQKYDPTVDLFSKRMFFNEMAGSDGHLTWAKVENWFNNHKIDIKTFRKIYDSAVLNNDGTLHWDHYADAVKKYHPDADLASKKALFDEVAGYDGKLTWDKVEAWFNRHKVEIKTMKPMNIDTFRTIYNGAVMNYDGTLHWDHFADALKKYDPDVDLTSKRRFFDQMAKPDGHLTWAKAENWFNNHRVDIQTFRKIYDRAVLNSDGTLHWDHYADALMKYDPAVNLEQKRAFFDEIAAPDGHLTWAKVENWFVNHRLTIKDQPGLIGGTTKFRGGGINIDTFRVIYHGAVMNDDGTLHWDHFADALQKYGPTVDLSSKRDFFK
jgi:hemolysin-activating ACP:hemolysin acyltransferase